MVSDNKNRMPLVPYTGHDILLMAVHPHLPLLPNSTCGRLLDSHTMDIMPSMHHPWYSIIPGL